MYTLIFSVFNTILNGSQTPYIIRAFSNNQTIITKVSSYGGIVSMLGGTLVSITFPILMARLATGSGGWRTLILIYAVPLAAIGILRFLLCKEDPSVDVGVSKKVSFKDIFMMMRKNKYCWYAAGINGVHNFMTGLAVGSYYFTYIIGDVSKYSIVSAFSVILLPVMFIFPKLMKKVNLAGIYTIFAGIAAFGYLLVFVGNKNLILVLIGVVVAMLVTLPTSYLGSLMGMQVATYNEYIGLPRMDGSQGIVSGFLGKIGNGVGAGLVGILLGLAGYVSSSSGDAVQPASALMMIRLMYSIIPLIGCVLIVFFALKFSKLSNQYDSMREEIEERKAHLQAEESQA